MNGSYYALYDYVKLNNFLEMNKLTYHVLLILACVFYDVLSSLNLTSCAMQRVRIMHTGEFIINIYYIPT